MLWPFTSTLATVRSYQTLPRRTRQALLANGIGEHFRFSCQNEFYKFPWQTPQENCEKGCSVLVYMMYIPMRMFVFTLFACIVGLCVCVCVLIKREEDMYIIFGDDLRYVAQAIWQEKGLVSFAFVQYACLSWLENGINRDGKLKTFLATITYITILYFAQ